MTSNDSSTLTIKSTLAAASGDRRIRAIALHLPQFHPIAENDEWWGKGFTEWTNTAKAQKLYPGHYQPHVPADLGFYDLRLPESRHAQAELAKEYGVEGFCYYHYWFGGRQVLERPVAEIVRSGQPDFPFCICWANETWSGIWHGSPKTILLEQTYPGDEDHIRHFEYLAPAFHDSRYITVDGRPLFCVYNPPHLADAERTLDLWRELGVKSGLPELFVVGVHRSPQPIPVPPGFDGLILQNLAPRAPWFPWSKPVKKIRHFALKKLGLPTIYDYASAVHEMLPARLTDARHYPIALPNWDNSPRSGANSLILHNSSPEKFRTHLQHAISLVTDRPQQHRIVILKSWNEWAEGNHLEPDLKFGLEYLEVLRQEIYRKA